MKENSTNKVKIKIEDLNNKFNPFKMRIERNGQYSHCFFWSN